MQQPTIEQLQQCAANGEVFYIRAGQLVEIGHIEKIKDESAQILWDGLPDQDKLTIKSLPNFDADIFEQCTGIRAD